MELLNFLYRNGLWISAPLLAAGVLLLVSFIRNVIRLRTEKLIVSVPLAERQSVQFNDAGQVVLCIEGPLFSRRFSKAEFKLFGSDGAPVEGRTTRFHAKSSGLWRVRMEMKTYCIPMPGSYGLHVLNLGAPQPKDREHLIIFMKPHLPQAIAYVVGIVLSSWICIGSIVLFLLRWLEVDAAG